MKDKELKESFNSGHPDAVNNICRHYYEFVFLHLKRSIDSTEDCKELTQEVFMQFIKTSRRESFRITSSVKYLLLKIAKDVKNSYYSRYSRFLEIIKFIKKLLSYKTVDYGDKVEKLNHCIRKLPRCQKKQIELHLKDFSYEAILINLKSIECRVKSVGTLQKRFERIKQKLKECIENG